MKKLKSELTAPNVAAALRWVFDPEMGYNIVDMGLLYGISISQDKLLLTVTFSTPACPLGEVIRQDIREQISGFFGEVYLEINVTFEPGWHPAMMSDDAKNAI
jgi:metal-sulfur cluster biosynthetic enzyme